MAMGKGLGALFSTIYVLGDHSRQATLPRFPQGENFVQIRNSLKWNLDKERSRGLWPFRPNIFYMIIIYYNND